jgi:hypothetical protein
LGKIDKRVGAGITEHLSRESKAYCCARIMSAGIPITFKIDEILCPLLVSDLKTHQ